MEEYKTIIEFDIYKVSNFGNVKNTSTNKILKPHDEKGYHRVNLSKNGKVTHKKVHRLVADAFLEKIDNKPCVDHIDNNKQNNNVNNLRWCNYQENQWNSKLSKSNTSGIKGVFLDKQSNKWRAHITIDGITFLLGLFEKIDDAKKARINKVNEVFGEFKNSCEN